MDTHPSLKQLDAGCRHLGLHPDVAKELISYLIVKRAMLSGDARCQATAQSMSPSVDMDQLWHWMLLNTHVRDEVHKLVGGDVPHSTDTESDPDPVKEHRRDVAQATMGSFGFTPRVHVWSPRFQSTALPKPRLVLPDAKDINVTVETLTGKSVMFRINNGKTPAALALKIQEWGGIPPDVQRLIYRGKQIYAPREDDGIPLGYYTSQADDVIITLVLTLKGC